MSGNAENGNLIELTDADFESAIAESSEPVLVDFWAPWCGPCRTVGPTIEELAGDYSGRVKVAKVNVDENQGVAGALGIMSIPTVVLFHGNQAVDHRVGAHGKAEYQAMLDKVLGEQAGN